jgi:ATP-binding cassette, subfamily B, bacterial
MVSLIVLATEFVVLSKSLQKLSARVPLSKSRLSAFLLNALVALAAPLLALVIGHLLQALSGQPHGPILRWLPALGSIPLDARPLDRVLWLLGLALLVSIVAAIILFLVYRLVQRSAVELEIQLIELVRKQVQQLARFRTLSAQQTAVLDGLEYHLPRVRAVMTGYWQTIPRHVVQLGACILLAGAIHLPLALLVIVACCLFFLIFRFVDRVRRNRLPVVRENATRLRSRIVHICTRGPLLDAVHEKLEIEKRFQDLLGLYKRDAVRSLTSSSWRVPTAVFGLTVLAGIVIFAVSVQWFRGNLPFPTIAVFACSLVAAAYSARRLLQVYRELKQISTASDELNRFLEIPIPETDDDRLVEMGRLSRRAELEHVTVHDSQGRKLLEDASVVFETGRLIAIVADQRLEAFTLAELLIGLGRPTSGRMLIDDLLVTDLKSDSLTRCAHWVAPDGGIVTGSIADNLRSASNSKLQQALDNAQLSDLNVRLSEGPHTLITPDDDRLTANEAFRLGVARAWLRDASIVVVEESEPEQDAEEDQKNLDAIVSLVRPDRITVVLPQRLATLRHCDHVVFVNEHRVMDVGTHTELIQKSELYRHLIYLRFNRFHA